MDFTTMFNPNSVEGLASTDYKGMSLAATKQRKLAEMLRQQLKDRVVDTPQMVGGQYIRPHWTNDVVNGLVQGVAAYQGAQADKLDVDTLAAQQGAADQWRAALPTSRTQETPLLDGQVGPGAPQVVPPTREAILKHTLEGLDNPLTAKEAMVTNQSLTSDLTRNEDMKFRDTQARQSALERSEAKQKDLEEKAAAAQLRSEDRAADRASREAAAREALELRRQLGLGQQAIAQQNLELRRQIADQKANKTADLKPLPSAQSKAYVENDAGMKSVSNALDLVGKNPKVFGLTNMLPNAMLTRMDPKGIEARAAVFNLGSLRIHDRSGAAVTASETPRLLPFIPTPGDDANAIKIKLNGFMREYKMMQDSIEDYAGTQGYKSPRKPTGDVNFGDLK